MKKGLLAMFFLAMFSLVFPIDSPRRQDNLGFGPWELGAAAYSTDTYTPVFASGKTISAISISPEDDGPEAATPEPATIPASLEPTDDRPQESTPTPNSTPKPSQAPASSPASTPKPSQTPASSPASTPKPSQSPTPSPSSTPKPSQSPTPSPSSTPKPSQTPTPSPTSTPKPSQSPTPTPTPTPAPIPTRPPTNGAYIVGYYAGWAAYSGYKPEQVQVSKLTHMNYAFAAIGDDLKIKIGDSAVDPKNFAAFPKLRDKNPKLRILISVGGWNDSGKFSDAALNEKNRTVFAESVAAFIKQYGFDGVDLDWEYPVKGGLASNTNRPEDKQNFTLLLKKLREVLDKQGQQDGRYYWLTIAGAAGSFYGQNVALSQIHAYLDYAVIMTYDIHGPWDSVTDFNAPLYAPTEASPQIKWSADSAVKMYTNAGFPASKLVLGIPFYGYMFSGAPNQNNGLFQAFTSAKSVTYDSIIANYASNSAYTRYYHSTSQVPWLFNGSNFISYDDAQSVAAKVSYIREKKLGGAAIWELSQNKDGTLLETIFSGLR